VAHVDAKRIGAGRKQRLYHRFAVRSGAKRRKHLDPAAARFEMWAHEKILARQGEAGCA
jgi:hypothetical protein